MKRRTNGKFSTQSSALRYGDTVCLREGPVSLNRGAGTDSFDIKPQNPPISNIHESSMVDRTSQGNDATGLSLSFSLSEIRLNSTGR